jgi:hypothetical protein
MMIDNAVDSLKESAVEKITFVQPKFYQRYTKINTHLPNLVIYQSEQKYKRQNRN